VSRRTTLAAPGGAALAGLAGCSGVTEQSFEAAPVVLPDAASGELALAETVRESETTTRDGPSGNLEVSITSHSAVYRRGQARGTPTVLEGFASSVNQTPGSGSAINAPASDLGVDEAGLGFLGDATIPGSDWSLAVPEGARGGDGVAPAQTMALVPGQAVGSGAVTYEGDEPGAFFSGETYFRVRYTRPTRPTRCGCSIRDRKTS
jgi:hypothetical protein